MSEAPVSYQEPAAIRSFLSRLIGVTFSASRQPVVTPVAIAGRQGIRGTGVLSASRVPVASDGMDGDFFINTAAAPRVLYGPKAGGAWPTGSPFVSGIADVPGLADRFTALLGSADGNHDTLGKLATLIEANRAQLTALLDGSRAELDTFVEVYNRFMADESAAVALNAALGSLSAAVTAHVARTDNPHAVTKAQVGLGNVANLSPADLAQPGNALGDALAAKAILTDTIVSALIFG